MTDRQYRQMLENRRPRSGRPLTIADELGQVVRQAAAAARRMNAVDGAWRRLAEPAWLAASWVARVIGPEVVIAVTDAALRFELQRRAARLAEALDRQVGGVRAVRFLPPHQADMPDHQPAGPQE
jgi:hypothetical protein